VVEALQGSRRRRAGSSVGSSTNGRCFLCASVAWIGSSYTLTLRSSPSSPALSPEREQRHSRRKLSAMKISRRAALVVAVTFIGNVVAVVAGVTLLTDNRIVLGILALAIGIWNLTYVPKMIRRYQQRFASRNARPS